MRPVSHVDTLHHPAVVIEPDRVRALSLRKLQALRFDVGLTIGGDGHAMDVDAPVHTDDHEGLEATLAGPNIETIPVLLEIHRARSKQHPIGIEHVCLVAAALLADGHSRRRHPADSQRKKRRERLQQHCPTPPPTRHICAPRRGLGASRVQTRPSALPLLCGSPLALPETINFAARPCAKFACERSLNRQGRSVGVAGLATCLAPRLACGAFRKSSTPANSHCHNLAKHRHNCSQQRCQIPALFSFGRASCSDQARGSSNKRGRRDHHPSPGPERGARKRKGASSYRGTARRPILAFFSVGEKSRVHRNTSERRASMAIWPFSKGVTNPVREAYWAWVTLCFARRTSAVGEDLRKKDCKRRGCGRAKARLGPGAQGRAAAAPCPSVSGAVQFVEQLARAFQVPGQTGVVDAQGRALQGNLGLGG